MGSFQDEMRRFLLTQHQASCGPEFWKAVGSGITLLYNYKADFSSLEAMLASYRQLKSAILELTYDQLAEDLMDELEAVLIQWYPMPVFWQSTLEDFKAHSAFQHCFNDSL